tara:strand:- start:1230 stop:1427 length:198 start_codon:yes stop_codon:yes gene_type:complete
MSKHIDYLEFRINQLEIALMNLMYVVANQEEKLPKFKENIKKAEEMTNEHSDIISLITNEDKIEA